MKVERCFFENIRIDKISSFRHHLLSSLYIPIEDIILNSLFLLRLYEMSV